MKLTHALIFGLALVTGCGGTSTPQPTGGGGTGGTAGGGAGGGGGGGTGGTGGAGGPGGSWLTGQSATLLASYDGATFTERTAPVTGDLYALTCVGHLDGWAAGAKGAIIGTHDGGITWTEELSGVTTSLRALSFADKDHGLAVGDAGVVLRTIDGGATWYRVSVATGADLRGVALSQFDGRAFVVGAGGIVLRSTDGGQSFGAPQTVTSAELRAVRFSGEVGVGYAVGDGGLVLSTHDGATWQPLASAPGNLTALSITDDASRIVAVGGGGLVWRSIDAGATWQPGASGVTASLATIGFSDDEPGTGWAAGAHGTLLVTHDGGATFSSLASPTTLDLYSVEDL